MNHLYHITIQISRPDPCLFLPVIPNVRKKALVQKPFPGLMLGATIALMIFSHMLAISMVQAAYMISIKRTSLIFGVLYGAWLFKEEKITERLTGAIIMIIGVFIISWFG